jgi:predicted ribosome quality control (RQC) complex YloA/Tae2 family protein
MYYWKASNTVDNTGSLKELPDLKRMVPVALDLSKIDKEGVRWVDMVGDEINMYEDLSILKEYLEYYEFKKNSFNKVGSQELLEKIGMELHIAEDRMRDSYAKFYPMLR